MIYQTQVGRLLTPAEVDGNFQTVDTRTLDGGWDDLVAPMELQPGNPSSPAVTEWMDGLYLPEFSSVADLAVLGKFHVNHRYKAGTMMYPHFHFSTSTASDALTGVVRLVFRYKLARRHDSTGQTTFTNAVELTLDFNIPLNSSGTHFVAEMPEGQGIPPTHIEPDVMILMETWRKPTHPNDTFGGSLWGITHDIHYQSDRIATLNRTPDFYA